MSDSVLPPSQPPPPHQPSSGNPYPYQPGPPSNTPPGPPQNFPQPNPYRPTGPPPKEGMSGCLIALIVGVVVAVAVIIAVAVFIGVAANSVANVIEEVEAQNATEIEDAEGCRIVDESTIELNLINNSSKQSSYDINTRFLDASGSRVGGKPFSIDYLRPGEELVAEELATPPGAAVSCEIATLSRFAAESREDIRAATCEVTGLNELGHFATQITVTSESSAESDYYVAFAFVSDQIRIGGGSAPLDDVEPGGFASGAGITATGGSIDDTLCEIVYVSRTSS